MVSMQLDGGDDFLYCDHMISYSTQRVCMELAEPMSHVRLICWLPYIVVLFYTVRQKIKHFP